jgi:hypothetical protein
MILSYLVYTRRERLPNIGCLEVIIRPSRYLDIFEPFGEPHIICVGCQTASNPDADGGHEDIECKTGYGGRLMEGLQPNKLTNKTTDGDENGKGGRKTKDLVSSHSFTRHVCGFHEHLWYGAVTISCLEALTDSLCC